MQQRDILQEEMWIIRYCKACSWASIVLVLVLSGLLVILWRQYGPVVKVDCTHTGSPGSIPGADRGNEW